MFKTISKFVLIMMCLLLSVPAIAADNFTFNFQGRLDGSDGNPVPDGNYQMMFFIYDDSIGGNLLWTESHPAVHTGNGFFGVDLGSANPCSLEIPALENIYLATQIGSLPPLARRLRITTSPQAGVARRLYGDIRTTPGSLLLRSPIDESQFHISSDTAAMSFGFRGPDGRNFFDVSGKPGSLGKLTWGLFNPQPEPPGYEAHALIQASTGPSGEASWVMFNPQPEPPGSDPFKLIETRNNIGGEAGLYMFNPQPEPPGSDPFFGLSATLNGPDMNFYAPQAGGAALVNNHPQLKMRCDRALTSMLLQRCVDRGSLPPDSVGVSISADSIGNDMKFFKGGNTSMKISTDASGTSMRFFDDGSEFMGLDPSPWAPGYDLKFYSAPNVQSIGLSSTGTASFLDENSQFMGIEPSPWHAGGDLTMYSAAGGPTLLLASNGQVSIGTGLHTNILQVVQSSATDPIADAWTTYSSRRWKTNIQPMQGALDKVMRLNAVTFDWKETGKHDIGLIAEEVGQVVPEVVKYEDNGIDAQSVDYARLTALLIEAVKDQQKMIELYKEGNEKMAEVISSLENRIIELEKRLPK